MIFSNSATGWIHLFATATFDASKQLRKVRITLGTNNSVVMNGVSSPLVLKDNDNFIVVNLEESTVAINSGGLTKFWVDIDAGNSIRFKDNQFELKPHVKVFSREKSASIEGIVLPGNAAAIVTASNGTDIATAKAEDSGEFKFIGLKPGTYTLLYHATANNYLDQTVTGVVVSSTEDVHVPNRYPSSIIITVRVINNFSDTTSNKPGIFLCLAFFPVYIETQEDEYKNSCPDIPTAIWFCNGLEVPKQYQVCPVSGVFKTLRDISTV